MLNTIKGWEKLLKNIMRVKIMSKIAGCRPGEKPDKDDKCAPPVDPTKQALEMMEQSSRKSTQRDAKFMIRYRTNKGKDWNVVPVGFTNKRDANDYFKEIINPMGIPLVEMDIVSINVKKRQGRWKIVNRDSSGRLITY